MSMCMGLTTLADANIQRLLDYPPLVWRAIAPDDPEVFAAARAGYDRRGLLSRLLGRGKQDRPVPELQLAAGECITADLDKAWHGIHYLLTGTAWEGGAPHGFLLTGGSQVGNIDVGYGPARALTARQTQEAHEALEALSDEMLRARFDPADMIAKEIYPAIWERPPEEDDTLGYLIEYLQNLRTFLREAVVNRLGVLVYLT